MQKSDGDGVLWAYCNGSPLLKDGIRVLPNEMRSEEAGENIFIDIKKREDYAFYIMFKSGIVGSLFRVFDPERDRLKGLREKNEKRELSFAISKGMDEQKLRAVAGAYGVEKAFEKDVLLVQDDLETLVIAMDEKKKKNPTNLMLKGISDFLAEIKSEDHLMPKAFIQMALDYQKMKWNAADRVFLLQDIEICTVPYDKVQDKISYCATVLRNPDNKDKWEKFLHEVLDEDYISGLDRYSIRWLAKEFDIPLNKKESELRTILLGKFRPE
jgi:hypothetical protein